MKVAVVGGGIFGVTTAIVLAKNGYSVDLFEKESDIFTHATGINQYRIHKGYHYPRSPETILACLKGEPEFREMFKPAVLDDWIEHYYCIAAEGSSISGEDYLKVLDEHNLGYRMEDSGIINPDKVSVSIRVNEYLYDPKKLYAVCWDLLEKYGVKVILSQSATWKDIKNYNLTVVATYSDNNAWVPTIEQREYQYEVCEKLILRLPDKYRKKSVVVMDGRFMCIDPYGRSGHYCMGNVVHAVHQTNIGTKIESDHYIYKNIFNQVLNKGVITNPPVTKFYQFMSSAEEYFPGISQDAKHIGSMFTVRTVLPFHEHDDARPTLVEQYGKVVTIFSGKIPTSVDAANQVLEIARRMI